EWLPFSFVSNSAELENLSPYDFESENQFDYGTNIIEGSDQLITAQQPSPSPQVQGEPSAYVSALIGVTGIPQNAQKEIMMRAYGMSPVTSRSSVGNADPSFANTLDVAIQTQKYFIDVEMFNSAVAPNTPFDYQNQTQNVSPSYLSDDTNITPQ
ncbi:MAG TPA: hypothetical protein VJ949_11180, partial [Cryomorphaceae bacterium]|nr:hypothetical protein [Cryomorphaceae bacterium]